MKQIKHNGIFSALIYHSITSDNMKARIRYNKCDTIQKAILNRELL